jgi:hypothetical protein
MLHMSRYTFTAALYAAAIVAANGAAQLAYACSILGPLAFADENLASRKVDILHS